MNGRFHYRRPLDLELHHLLCGVNSGYLPGKYCNLDSSRYRTGADLRDLIKAFHTANIKCLAGIKGGWEPRLGPWAIGKDNTQYSFGTGNYDTSEGYAAALHINHLNKWVQKELTDWLNWLKSDVGFNGWRLDFAKGYSTHITKGYIQRARPEFVVGEVWATMGSDPIQGPINHRRELDNWVSGTVKLRRHLISPPRGCCSPQSTMSYGG
ncbi:Alpha-amylase isozyme 3D [Nymphaea thermarum]|nr:Alpha-amylase isozyme 3D [Nymphaea thermarum]